MREQREAESLAVDTAAAAQAAARIYAEAAAGSRADAHSLAEQAAQAEFDAARRAEAAARAQAEARQYHEARRRAAEAADGADASARAAAESAAQADASARALAELATSAEAAALERREAARLAAESAMRAEAAARAVAEAATPVDAGGDVVHALDPATGRSEPARVVDDLLLHDTKPERATPRTRPVVGAAIATTPAAGAVVQELAAAESGATTTRLAAVIPVDDQDPNGDDDDEEETEPGYRVSRTTVRGIAAPRADADAGAGASTDDRRDFERRDTEQAISVPAVDEPRDTEQAISVPAVDEPRMTERSVAAPRITERGMVAPRVTDRDVAEPWSTEQVFAAAAAPSAIGVTDPDSTPSTILDEPSDGIIRQHITTADTAPVKRRRLPSDPPEDDRPEAATGEITAQARVFAEPRRSEPTILVADLVSDLVSDRASNLSVVSGAVSDPASDRATAPVTPASVTPAPARDKRPSEPRRDAVAFSDLEEAFFRAGHDKDAVLGGQNAESFDDLDEGYRPLGFWDRLRGKGSRKRRKSTPPPGKR